MNIDAFTCSHFLINLIIIRKSFIYIISRIFNTFNKTKYQEYRAEREKHGKTVAAQLTALYNNPSEFFNSRVFNYGVQNNVVSDTDDADTKEAKDGLSEAFVTQVTTALRTNTLNYFKDHIASFKETSPEEFEEAFGFE